MNILETCDVWNMDFWYKISYKTSFDRKLMVLEMLDIGFYIDIIFVKIIFRWGSKEIV